MEDRRPSALSSRRSPGAAGSVQGKLAQRARDVPESRNPPSWGRRLRRLGDCARRWLRLPGTSGTDALDDFAKRLARASTTAEVRTALADAARKLGGRRVPEALRTPAGPSVVLPLRFGGRDLGSLTLVIDPARWSERQRLRLETLAALAAAAEIALGSTRRPGSALRPESVRDPATGLPSAAFLETHLTQALALAKRRKEPLVLMAVELGGLALLRDRDGPEFAGMALNLAARALAGTLRASDLVVRLDGDRLAAVLPGAGKLDAVRLGEVVRRAVAEAGVASSVPTELTASVGIAAYPDDAHTPLALRAACEEALRDRGNPRRRPLSSRSALDTEGRRR